MRAGVSRSGSKLTVRSGTARAERGVGGERAVEAMQDAPG